jgi:hypothetical protein
MASAIRFTEVINNNGTALTGNALRETAICSDDFKWAYAGSGTNRYVEFYDAQAGANRVATVTTGSYANLASVSGCLAQVTSTVSGVGKMDAPVTGVSTATGAFILNLEHIAIAYLTAAGSSNVEYIFKGTKYDFAINRTPTQIQSLSLSGANVVKMMCAPFPLLFFNGNRVLNTTTTGASGCIFAFSKLKSAGVIVNDRRFIEAGVTGVVSEIYLDTPDSLTLATTTALSTIIPGF